MPGLCRTLLPLGPVTPCTVTWLKGKRGKGQVWETHSQTIRSDNWRDFRKKCLFQCGGPAGIRTQISGYMADPCMGFQGLQLAELRLFEETVSDMQELRASVHLLKPVGLIRGEHVHSERRESLRCTVRRSRRCVAGQLLHSN